MEMCKGKVIELQTENYVVKADLELMTNKLKEQANFKENRPVLYLGEQANRYHSKFGGTWSNLDPSMERHRHQGTEQD
jgi:hypothetical protein